LGTVKRGVALLWSDEDTVRTTVAKKEFRKKTEWTQLASVGRVQVLLSGKQGMSGY